jgi:hypothetical protein
VLLCRSPVLGSPVQHAELWLSSPPPLLIMSKPAIRALDQSGKHFCSALCHIRVLVQIELLV